MPSSPVYEAVKSRLEEEWDGIDDYPLHDVNAFSANPGQFIDIEFPASTETRMSMGTPALFREEGGIRFVIYVDALSGVAAALAAADQVRALFRDKEAADLGLIGMTTYEASPAVFDSSFTVNGFYPVPFVVTYEFDFEQ